MLTLGGCGTLRPGSVQAGECKVFLPPVTQVEGKAPVDQYWIDDTIESGVAGCGWKRPAPKKKAPVVKAKPKAKQPAPKAKTPEVKPPVAPPPPPPPVVEPVPVSPAPVAPPVVEKPLPWYSRTWIWLRDHLWSTPW